MSLKIEYHDGYEEGDDLPEDILNNLQYAKRRIDSIIHNNHGLEYQDITVHLHGKCVEVIFLSPWQKHSFSSRH